MPYARPFVEHSVTGGAVKDGRIRARLVRRTMGVADTYVDCMARTFWCVNALARELWLGME